MREGSVPTPVIRVCTSMEQTSSTCTPALLPWVLKKARLCACNGKLASRPAAIPNHA